MTLRFAAIHSDHAVIQREKPAVIKGWGEPGQAVTVGLAGLTRTTTCEGEGKWRVEFPPLESGGPHELRAESAGQSICSNDIHIGEVWIASGQSNMEWGLDNITEGRKLANEIATDRVRFLKCQLGVSETPLDDVTAAWEILTPEAALGVSAIGALFASKLASQLGIHVGIIQNAWGGSLIEPWIDKQTYEEDSRMSQAREYRQNLLDQSGGLAQEYARSIIKWYIDNPHMPRKLPTQGEMERVFAQSKPEEWIAVVRPFAKPASVPDSEDAIVWFRASVDLSKSDDIGEMWLNLGQIDAQIDVFVDSQPVHTKNDLIPWHWLMPVRFPLPERFHGRRSIEISVRCLFYFCEGKLYGNSECAIEVKPRKDAADQPALTAVREWECLVVEQIAKTDPSTLVTPRPWMEIATGSDLGRGGIMFNSLIHPISTLGIRGVLWYQGESNARNREGYAAMLTCMIESWRAAFHQDLAFGIVQLAGFGDVTCPSNTACWPWVRTSQELVCETVQNTGLVTAVHLGDRLDIHPKNKAPIADYLAGWAMERVYQRPEFPAWNPGRVHSVTRHGSTIKIELDARQWVDASVGNSVTGFGLAGEDKQLHPADAQWTDEKTLVVQCAAVPEPEWVSYDWADCPPCTVRDENGLPLLSFLLEVSPGQ